MLLINQTIDAEASQTICRCHTGPRKQGRVGVCLVAITFALMVGACENRNPVQPKGAPKPVQASEVYLSPAQSEGLQYLAAYEKQVQASADALLRVKKAMEAVLFDSTSAQYSGIRLGRNGAVCGKYNAKNRYGAYVGFRDFVMTDDGRIVTNDTSDEISGTYYYGTYVEACGTKAEIAAYRSLTSFSSPSPPTTGTEAPSQQEPDRILDAPPQQNNPPRMDSPTA